jgi:hypothetical protein
MAMTVAATRHHHHDDNTGIDLVCWRAGFHTSDSDMMYTFSVPSNNSNIMQQFPTSDHHHNIEDGTITVYAELTFDDDGGNPGSGYYNSARNPAC